ncbi:MAG TPA: hypothetical protein VE619_01420 [Nitrososphaeraceae archaeon]|nr:hypothetical protein [Nitrososphaeraceae archaeon]
MTKVHRNGIVDTGCLYKSGTMFTTIHLLIQLQSKKKTGIIIIIKKYIEHKEGRRK